MASAHAPGQHCSKATLPKVALSRATRAWRLAPETKNTPPNLISNNEINFATPAPGPAPAPRLPLRLCASSPAPYTEHRPPRRPPSTPRHAPTAHRPTERVATARPRGPRPHRAAPCTDHGAHAARALRTRHCHHCIILHGTRTRATSRTCVRRVRSGRELFACSARFLYVCGVACAGRVCRVFKRNYIFATTKKCLLAVLPFFSCRSWETPPPPPPARGTTHGSCLDHDHESLEAAGASGGQSLEAPPLSPLTDSDTWHTCGTLVE